MTMILSESSSGNMVTHRTVGECFENIKKAVGDIAFSTMADIAHGHQAGTIPSQFFK